MSGWRSPKGVFTLLCAFSLGHVESHMFLAEESAPISHSNVVDQHFSSIRVIRQQKKSSRLDRPGGFEYFGTFGVSKEPANSSTEAANKQTSGVPQGGPNVHPHSYPPSGPGSDRLIEDLRRPVCFWEEPFVPLGQQLHVELHIMSAW